MDASNTTGVEDGTEAHPFRTLRRGIAAAKSGAIVGVAAGIYADEFPADYNRQNYTIDGLRSFTLMGMGAKHTIVRGNHSGSLIYLVNGASALIYNLTLEGGGLPRNSVGGGIQVSGNATPSSVTVRNVILRGNTSVNGAVTAEGVVNLRLVNVLIAGNTATNYPGAVYLGGHSGPVTATLINTTVTGNTAAIETGGVLIEHDARLRLVNTIIWNNTQAEIAMFTENPEGRLSVAYSDVGERLYPGQGNLSVDPRFVDPATGNFRLGHTSPAIDAGTSVGAPLRDLFNASRPIDGNLDCQAEFDMGALEFNPRAGC